MLYIKRFAIVKQKAKACSKNMCHKIRTKKKEREREKVCIHFERTQFNPVYRENSEKIDER